jgi:hypothetical protein
MDRGGTAQDCECPAPSVLGLTTKNAEHVWSQPVRGASRRGITLIRTIATMRSSSP